MRKTKIMSMLLALAMVLSCFSGMALAEETATVAITQNGMALDGLDGMPLSFSPIVTFENPLAEGTDLSGITLTDGEAVLNPTVTQGAVTDGVFTTATVVMPVLTNGTEYTLNVPAISDNDAYSATFKTVEGAYILKEDFNGDIKSDFYQRSELTSRIDSSFLKDTGTDGKVDSVKYTLSLHPTIHFPTNIATAGMNEVVLDTRIMFTAKDDAHRVGDGSIFSGDDNSGHLIKILGVSGNDRAYVRTNDSGELTYGDTAGYGLNTGYKVYENTWYNISIALNSTRKQMKVSIYDDAGNYYCGDWTKTSYGGREISYINKIMLPYGSFISSVTDYIYVYDNAASSLDEISATYGDGKDLNGAKGVEKTFDATLKFENPVTEADMARIIVSDLGEGTVEKILADENTVTMRFAGLDTRTGYTIDVPMMNNNKGTQISFCTKGEDYYLYQAEFDGYDPEFTRDEAGTIENGVWNLPTSAGGSTGYVSFDPAIDVSTNKNLVFEARIKYNNKNASEDGLVKCSQAILNFMGQSINYQAPVYSIDGKLGVGGNNKNNVSVVTDYDLKEGEWYTFRMKFNSSRNAFTLYVTDDSGNAYESETIPVTYNLAINSLYKINLQYRYEVSSVIDYLRVWDEDLIPAAEATYGEYNEKLDGAGAIKGGEEVKLTFPFAMAESELTVKVDGTELLATLLSDGKVATVVLPTFEARTTHKMTVDAAGGNKAAEFTFRAADEGKYVYRAEFDGYDDDSVWYTKLNENVTGKTNSNANTEEGVYVSSFKNNPYAAFIPVFENYSTSNFIFADKTPLASQKIDLTGKENITIETRVKMGEGTLDKQFMYMGYNMIMLGIGSNNELRYDANAGTGIGQPFMVNDKEFTIEPNVWYTIKFNIDFTSHKYSVSVDNGNGDIANSGTLNFIYNNTRTNIVDFRFSRMLNDTYAQQTIDYFRIIDEDYGKVKVTYDNGVELSNSVLIEADDVYTFTAMNEVTDTSNITLFDENGEKITIDCTASENVVTIDPVDSQMKYNTKYALTIPKSCIGSDSDQIVTFATVWDNAAEFTYPAGYSKDDALNVVFFGGSITNQNGWRKYTTEWFAEKFPNATCYNSAVGGTGSEYGWIRLGKDVISHNPDVVFVEFAVNDSTATTTTKYMESIVRNLNALDKKPVIIFVYTANINFATNIYTISEHERLAKAYGIPTINIHDYAQSLYNTDSQFATDWDNKAYLSDGTHPNEAGNKLYGDYVTALLASDSSKYFVKPLSNASVEALTDYKDYVYDYKTIDKTLTVSDNTYTVDFAGSEFIVQYKRTTSGGKVKVVIDGDEENATVVDTYGDSMPFGHQISFMDLDIGKHTATITLLTDEVNENITLGEQTLQLMCVYWKGIDGEISAPVFDADAVTVGEELTATVTCKTYIEEDVYLAIALYDASGRLTRLSKIATKTDSTGEEKEISVSIVPQTGDAKAKAFIWDSLTGMTPLVENAAIGF